MPESFRCPSCGGPLEYQQSANRVVLCAYCGTPVVVPDRLRDEKHDGSARAPRRIEGGDKREQLSAISFSLRSGRKIEAIKLYRDTFGVGLKEAKDAVEHLAAGEPVTLGTQVVITHDAAGDNARREREKTRSGGCLGSCVFLLILVGATVAAVLYSTGTLIDLPALETLLRNANPASPVTEIRRFGSPGIEPGYFTDARTIAVDGEGRIYVGEYEGGRIQRFDSQGAFLNQWRVEQRYFTSGLAAARDGTVYVLRDGALLAFNGATGEELPPPSIPEGRYEDVTVTSDGALLLIREDDDVIRVTSQGVVSLEIPDAIEGQTGDSELDAHVAEDGNGNIYVLGRFNETVFRYGPDGRYINRFGSRGDATGQFNPLSPNDIAVDAQGRIYVGEFMEIEIYEPDGRPVDTIDIGMPVFGLAFNAQNHLLVVARDHVLEYELR